jgi:cob(I)alamin adenosyltransferase
MSIITGRGDDGETDLMFGRRIAKTSVRVAAIGSVDELNAALGVARTVGSGEFAAATIDAVQERLVSLMGQLATLSGDSERYLKAAYGRIQADDVQWLEEVARALEATAGKFTGWARPGAGAPPASAHLDLARAIARRAERDVRLLDELDGPLPGELLLFLNRLSDVLWLMARHAAHSPVQ